MTTLLQINASINSDNGQSSQLANQFVAAFRTRNPDAKIVVRHVAAADPVPHLNAERFGAFVTKPEKRSTSQRAVVAYSDILINELKQADVIVLGLPMYNFGVPSQLKAYFDHIARAGRTFRYTESGAQGLLKGKKVFVVVSRGGIYDGVLSAQMMDFQKPYLRAMLGFLGLTDVTFIHAEGQNVSAEAAADGLARARNSIADAVPQILAA